MFKLVKIMGANSNVPEPIRLYVDQSNNLMAGCIYYIDNNGIIAEPENWFAPMVCAIEDVYHSEAGLASGLCYFVTPQMIFETKVANSPANIVEGTPFKIVTGNEYEGIAISTDVGDGSEVAGNVINARSYKSTGKVLVRFLCTKGEKE